MKTIIALLLSVAALAPAALAQFAYTASTGNVTLNSAGTAATIQQPAATCGATGTSNCSLPVTFPTSTVGGANATGASVYVSVAATVTFSRNCTTPATATAGTITGPATNPPPVFQFFTASNASGCTTVWVYNHTGGYTQSFDMSTLPLATGNSQSNITITISSITGTANITFNPLERH